jgi:hypothetical protein
LTSFLILSFPSEWSAVSNGAQFAFTEALNEKQVCTVADSIFCGPPQTRGVAEMMSRARSDFSSALSRSGELRQGDREGYPSQN